MFITVTGGSGSGKSAFAETCALRLAHADAGGASLSQVFSSEGAETYDAADTEEEENSGQCSLIYLAAMNPAGREGRMRVKHHRAMRRGKGFRTIERQRQLTAIPEKEILGRTVLVEDLSNLISNELFTGENPAGGACGQGTEAGDAFLSPKAGRACTEIREGILYLASRAEHLILVMNEIFSDGIRYDPQTDQFLRAAGMLNREFVSRADLSFEIVFGIPLILKGDREAAKMLLQPPADR